MLISVATEKVQPYISKSYTELAEYMNAYEQAMDMKLEAICDKAIWVQKKRYILNVYSNEGVEYKSPKIKVMGLEVKKSSTPGFFRDKLEKSIDIILNKDEEELIRFVKQVKDEIRTLNVIDIAFPRSVNGVTEYSDSTHIFRKGTPFHVRDSLLYNHLLKTIGLDKKYPYIKEGDKIKFCYMKIPNPLRNNVIAFINGLPDEFELNEFIDYDTQFEKVFLDPLKIILDSIGWKVEKTQTLEDFFT
jgi:hypothetical protein